MISEVRKKQLIEFACHVYNGHFNTDKSVRNFAEDEANLVHLYNDIYRLNEHYNILIDLDEFNRFVSIILPDLQNDEQFYCSLLARNKWNKESDIGSKVQLKRFTSGKEFLVQKLTQLETKMDSYQDKNKPVPQENLGVYIMPNPRNLFNAGQDLIGQISKNTKKRVYHMNPQSMALSCIQENCSRNIYYDLDVDLLNLEYKHHYLDLLSFSLGEIGLVHNKDFFIIETKNGYHFLLNISKVVLKIGNSWFKKIESIIQIINKIDEDHVNIEMNADNLLPIPGCTQGGFVPKLL